MRTQVLNKTLCKLELILLKIIPIIIALSIMLNSITAYFGISLHVFSYISGIGYIPLIFLYISSYVFRFCEYHRIFLYYIAVTNTINIIDYEYGIPVTYIELFVINCVLIGITIFLVLYLYVKTHKKVIS